MEKEYTKISKIIRAENPVGSDCLQNQEPSDSLIEQYDESSRVIWAENPVGYLIKPNLEFG